MALSIKYLGKYPANSTQVDASTFTYTNGVDSTTYTGYIAGYLDGENRAKLFYTDATPTPLPTLTSVTQVSQVDAAGTTKTGAYYVQLAFSPLSPDATSANSEIYLDQSGLLIAASTSTG